MAAVKGPRRISRRERAEQTRARIIESAYRLFSRDGYEATTIQAVAEQAGVAVQTVYFTFRTKSGLLAATESRAIPGGDKGLDWRAQVDRELRAESDPESLVVLWVAATATVLNRITAFVAMVGAGVQYDPESVDRRNRERDRWFEVLIDRLDALGALKRGLTPARALDVARALVRVEAYQELTRSFGWSEQEWVDWSTGVLSRELLV